MNFPYTWTAGGSLGLFTCWNVPSDTSGLGSSWRTSLLAATAMEQQVQNTTPRCHVMIAPWCRPHCSVRGCRALTWVWVIRTHRAEQVLLSLIVDLAQQLTLLQDKLIAFPQLPVTHAAAEAIEVVDTLQGTHHKLCGGNLLHAATALGRKQPLEKKTIKNTNEDKITHQYLKL